MSTKVAFQNPVTKQTKIVKVGFSITSFLFSGFLGIPLFARGLYGWGFLMLCWPVIAIVAATSSEESFAGVILIISIIQLAFGFGANKMAANKLVNKGWKLLNPESTEGMIARSKFKLPPHALISVTNNSKDGGIEHLEKLANLKEKGLITDEEFHREKAKLFA